MGLHTTLAALTISSVGLAQPRTADHRAELIRQAAAARDAGDHASALRAAREAGVLRMTPSLRLFIAEEGEAIRDFPAAYDDARECVAELDRDPSAQDARSLRASCAAMSRRLESRVGRVVIEVPAGLDATVWVNGNLVEPAIRVRGFSTLVGPATVEAEARGQRRFRRAVLVVGGEDRHVRVEFPTPEASSRVATSPSVPEARTPTRTAPGSVMTEPTELPRASDAPPESDPGAGPWVLVGVGAASLVASGVFFALREGAISDRDALCESSSGDCVTSDANAATRATDAQSSAVTFNTVSMVTLGVGAAAVAGGLIWWLVGRGSTPRERPRAALMFAPRANGAMVGISGRL